MIMSNIEHNMLNILLCMPNILHDYIKYFFISKISLTVAKA